METTEHNAAAAPTPTPWHVAVESMVSDRIAERIAEVFDGLTERVEEMTREEIERTAEDIDATEIAEALFDGWQGQRRWDSMVESIANDITAEEVAEALGFDADDIAGALDLDDIAQRFDASSIAEAVAERMDADEIAACVSVDEESVAERVADNIGASEVAEWMSANEVADYLDLGEIADAVSLVGLAAALDHDALVAEVAEAIGNETVVALRAEVETLRERVDLLDGALGYVVQSLAAFAVPFVQSIEAAAAEAQRMTEANVEQSSGTESGGLYL